jgi:hypothetical protein
MTNTTNDIRALQQLPVLDGPEEEDGYDARGCSQRSCALAGPTCP